MEHSRINRLKLQPGPLWPPAAARADELGGRRDTDSRGPGGGAAASPDRSGGGPASGNGIAFSVPPAIRAASPWTPGRGMDLGETHRDEEAGGHGEGEGAHV